LWLQARQFEYSVCQLLAGVISIETTVCESKEGIASFLEQTKKYVDPNRLILGVSGFPELLPRKIMDRKIENLKECLA